MVWGKGREREGELGVLGPGDRAVHGLGIRGPLWASGNGPQRQDSFVHEVLQLMAVNKVRGRKKTRVKGCQQLGSL